MRKWRPAARTGSRAASTRPCGPPAPMTSRGRWGQTMNLDTSYLGLKLRNPLVASAGPMTQTADRIALLAEAGVGAVVLPSLFEEQIRAEADRDERSEERRVG